MCCRGTASSKLPRGALWYCGVCAGSSVGDRVVCCLPCFFYPSDALVDLKSQNTALVTFLRLFVRVDSVYSQTAVFLKFTSWLKYHRRLPSCASIIGSVLTNTNSIVTVVLLFSWERRAEFDIVPRSVIGFWT